MPLAKRLLPVLFALLWAPLAVHCQLEALTGWDLLRCEMVPAVPDSPSHCDDEACNDVESGLYQLPPDQIFIAPVFMAVLEPATLEESISAPVFQKTLHLEQGPPPDFPRPWQFFFRAALPGRAPSVNS